MTTAGISAGIVDPAWTAGVVTVAVVCAGIEEPTVGSVDEADADDDELLAAALVAALVVEVLATLLLMPWPKPKAAFNIPYHAKAEKPKRVVRPISPAIMPVVGEFMFPPAAAYLTPELDIETTVPPKLSP